MNEVLKQLQCDYEATIPRSDMAPYAEWVEQGVRCSTYEGNYLVLTTKNKSTRRHLLKEFKDPHYEVYGYDTTWVALQKVETPAEIKAREKEGARLVAEAEEAASKAAAKKAADQAERAAEAARIEAAAQAAAHARQQKIDNVPFPSARDLALVFKDPDGHVGEMFRVWGQVTQFDSATGMNAYLADVANRNTMSYGYFDGESAMFRGGEAGLQDIVEGDVFIATVKVDGSLSYGTQIGGNTTVPQFDILKITRQ
jgi:hypothetical protein